MIKEYYQKEIIKQLQEKFDIKNIMAVPKVEKIVLNVGFGRHSKEKDYIENVVSTLTAITGQKPILTKAKISVSAFKVRKGMVIGAKVTLRGKRMYQFLEKMVHVAFPRVRDFRGIEKKLVDMQGNLTVGFKEHLAFGEIKSDDIDKVHGLEVSVVTSANNREEGLELLSLLGFPFKK